MCMPAVCRNVGLNNENFHFLVEGLPLLQSRLNFYLPDRPIFEAMAFYLKNSSFLEDKQISFTKGR